MLRLPKTLHQLLFDASSWAADGRELHHGSPAYHLANSLWTTCRMTVPESLRPRVCVMLERGNQPKFELLPLRPAGRSYAIRFTSGLVAAIDTYTRAWLLHHDPSLSAEGMTAKTSKLEAQRIVLDLGQGLRWRGQVEPQTVALTVAGEELARQLSVNQLRFLTLHECAHLQLDHVDRRPDSETAADALAFQTIVRMNGPTMPSLRVVEILFELLHFIRASAVVESGTHPYPFQRYLRLAAMTDGPAYEQARSQLSGEWATFWYLAPERR